jgi:hypothetical protein
MVCYIVNGGVGVWLLAFITSFLMAMIIVLVQWARRKELLDLPAPVLVVLYSLFYAWISTGLVGAVLAYFAPTLRHCPH